MKHSKDDILICEKIFTLDKTKEYEDYFLCRFIYFKSQAVGTTRIHARQFSSVNYHLRCNEKKIIIKK